MPALPIVHIEISAKDLAAASTFYSELFGWQIEVDTDADYYMFAAEGGPGGGFVHTDGVQYKAGDIIPYLETDDIDGLLKKIEAMGGKALTKKTEIPGMGWYAFFADPTGNRLGLYTGLPSQNS